MSDWEITSLSLTEVARQLAKRELSSLEVTRACLERLETEGLPLNLIAGIDREPALEAAKEADRELAKGRRRGSLHGVPLGHKDMFYRTGRESACGSRIRTGFTPDHTATVLERLDDNGALDIVRLNMSEFGIGASGRNEITGTPRNPWKPNHVTGGSSSGSAAAVAARLIYGALGSDTGGSVRLPAAFCGVVGLRPTRGWVSRHGVMPLSFTLDAIGPLARTAADCALLFQSIAGHDPKDPATTRRRIPDFTEVMNGSIRGLRVAVPEDYFYDAMDPEVARLVRASLDVLRALGAEIVAVTIPNMARAGALVALIATVEGAATHARWLRERSRDYGSETLAWLLTGLVVPATRYVEALKARRLLLAEFADAVFARADVLHVPTASIPAPAIADVDTWADTGVMDSVARLSRCTRPFSCLGLPAVSVPAGFTVQGLPVAFQLIGRSFDERLLLGAACAYERETAWASIVSPVEQHNRTMQAKCP